MKILLSWINDFVKPSLSPEKLAERLSVCLTEVEKIDYLDNEIVLEIENKALSHRADCFSLICLAREIAAITGTTLKTIILNSTLNLENPTLPLSVLIENSDLCWRYSAIVITNLSAKPSPEKIQQRLQLSGIRPLFNLVDITNYIMLETGQPLHAFDYDKLAADKKIIVRTAKPRETIKTLDNVERPLDPRMLLITDSDKAIAIAGLMGAENTEVSEQTKTIVLESANFERYNNRYTSAHLGLRTEASLRFEKGQDPNMTIDALSRAALMYRDLAQGSIASSLVDIYPSPVKMPKVKFNPDNVEKKLGINIPADKIEDILHSLGFIILKDKIWYVTPPSFRQDIAIEADLWEEVARVYGYDKITPSLASRSLLPPEINKAVVFERKIKTTLCHLGLTEIYSYSFINPRFWQDCGLESGDLLKIKNPLSPELSALRNTLVPCIIEKTMLNAKNFDHFALFEVGKAIIPDPSNALPKEIKKITGTVFSVTADVYPKTKGSLELFLHELGIDTISFEPDILSHLPFNANETARIIASGKKIGTIGNIDNQVKQKLGILGYLTVFELDFETLLLLSPGKKSYHPLPKYPYISFDLSFILPVQVLIQDLLTGLKDLKLANLVSIEPFDVFINPKLGEGKKSVALRLIFGSQTKTLTNEEIKPIILQIETLVTEKYKGIVRKENL